MGARGREAAGNQSGSTEALAKLQGGTNTQILQMHFMYNLKYNGCICKKYCQASNLARHIPAFLFQAEGIMRNILTLEGPAGLWRGNRCARSVFKCPCSMYDRQGFLELCCVADTTP